MNHDQRTGIPGNLLGIPIPGNGGKRRLTKLEFTDFDNEIMESMAYLFEGCECLEELDTALFSHRGITNLGSMFKGC